MPSSIFVHATEYRRLAVTIAPGHDEQDIQAVGVALTSNGNQVPDPSGQNLGEFTEVTMDDGDILVLIGPRDGDLNPAAGQHQLWTLIQTADEDIIDAPDTLTVQDSA